MAGVKGRGGPPPKRNTQKHGHRSQAEKALVEQVVDPNDVVIPEAPDRWHEVARIWYDSLARSGQSVFYTSSDWATAYVLAESISRELKPQPVVVGSGAEATVEMHNLPPKGAALGAWLKGMAALMTTEGERRRARLELERPRPGAEAGGVGGSVSWLDAARRGSTG